MGIDYAVTVDLRNLTVVMSLQPCLLRYSIAKSLSLVYANEGSFSFGPQVGLHPADASAPPEPKKRHWASVEDERKES